MEEKKQPKNREQIEIDAAKQIQEELTQADIKSEFYLEIPLTLNTSEAKRLFRRVFSQCQAYATAATLMTRKYRLMELSNKNEEIIDEALKHLAKDLQKV